MDSFLYLVLLFQVSVNTLQIIFIRDEKYVDDLNLTANYIHGRTQRGEGLKPSSSPQSKI